jgi:RHS repeat-associated protein
MEGAGGIGGLLARSSGYSLGTWSTHYYYHADGNGNITYLVDGSQNLAATYRYDAFGNTLSSSGTEASANLYRFSSREIHADSGMYIYLYRFYDPLSERWINRDPLEDHAFVKGYLNRRPKIRRLMPSSEGRINLYTFVLNAPTVFEDSFGLTISFAPGTPSGFEDHWLACLNRLARSPIGRKLLSMADEPWVDVSIVADPGAGGQEDPTEDDSPMAPSGTIYLNVDDPLGIGPGHLILEYPGEIPPYDLNGAAIVFGHELAHVLGWEDEPDGTIVSDVENPVRDDLGVPPRGSKEGAPILQAFP